MMDMKAAMAETLVLAREYGMDLAESRVPSLDYTHLVSMYERVVEGVCDDSEGKLGRWLGWMQAAVVSADVGLTLEHMKELNRRYTVKSED